MSYSKFLSASDKHSAWRKQNNLPNQHYEKTFEEVRDIWIKEEKFEELISFILECWDSGNCDDFIPPIVSSLVEKQRKSEFKKLWKGIIRQRMSIFWDYADLSLNWKDLENVDLSEFKFSDPKTYKSPERVTAYFRNYTLQAIDQYLDGLDRLSDDKEKAKIKIIRDTVLKVQKPKPKPTSDKRKIDEKLFWDLINESRLNSENKLELLENLKEKLEKFRPAEIKKFHKILLSKINELNHWDIWALAYIVRSGCGDDAFDYFKAWVISIGSESFEIIKNLKQPDINDLFNEDPQLEELFYLAEEVYEIKTGEFMPLIKMKKQKLKGEKWDENSISDSYPELYKAFN